MSTPILPFAVWPSGSNQARIPANDNSLRHQILSGLVLNDATTAQPGSPAEGDIYILPATHTGAQWAGFDEDDLVIFNGGTWYAFAPVEGVVVNLNGTLRQFISGAWAGAGGVGADADDVTYDNATSGLTATDVQAAIDEIAAGGASGDFVVQPQVPMRSSRFASEDGTFRDPRLTGDGTFVLGTPALLVDDAKYNSFPLIRRMRNGQLLAAFHKGDAHNIDNSGKLVGRIATEGNDGALTWGAEFDIYDDPSLSVICVGLGVISTGRIFASYSTRNGTTDPLDGVRVVYSDDNAATWSSPITVNSSLTSYSYCSGSVTELPNGDLLLTVEGQNSGDTFSRMRVLKSTDEGLTWGSEVEIATGTRNYFEGQLHLLPDGRMIVFLRTGTTSGDIYTSLSLDSGATWSAPAVAFAGCGQPNPLQLSTGTLIVFTRRAGDFAIVAFISTNNARTWSAELQIDGTVTMEYGCGVELLDGRLLILYGDEVGASNADLYTILLTENRSPVNGVLPAIAVTANGATHNADPDEAGHLIRFSGTGAKVWACDTADGFVGNRIFHVANRGASGNVTLTPTGVTLNAPKGGTLILEPGDTVSVHFISATVADVFGTTS